MNPNLKRWDVALRTPEMLSCKEGRYVAYDEAAILADELAKSRVETDHWRKQVRKLWKGHYEQCGIISDGADEFTLIEKQLSQARQQADYYQRKYEVLKTAKDQEAVRILCGCGDIYTYPLIEGRLVDVGTDHRMMCANCARTE